MFNGPEERWGVNKEGRSGLGTSQGHSSSRQSPNVTHTHGKNYSLSYISSPEYIDLPLRKRLPNSAKSYVTFPNRFGHVRANKAGTSPLSLCAMGS